MLTTLALAPSSRDAWVGDLFAPGVLSLSAPPFADPSQLFPDERALVARAGDARRREFATGRLCARRLLAELDLPDRPLLRGADRAPLWPRGATGSISHCADLCVVVVARRTRFLALGVDVEVADPLEAELWSTVCTPRELDLLDGIRETERGRLVRVLFSAKESIYKCVRAAQGPELAFHDIELRLEPGRGRFAARWRKASEGDGCPRGRCSGRYALRGRWIFTGVSFPASQPAPRWPGL